MATSSVEEYKWMVMDYSAAGHDNYSVQGHGHL